MDGQVAPFAHLSTLWMTVVGIFGPQRVLFLVINELSPHQNLSLEFFFIIIYLFIYLLTYLFFYLLIYLLIYVFIYLFTYFFTYLFIYLFTYLSIFCFSN